MPVPGLDVPGNYYGPDFEEPDVEDPIWRCVGCGEVSRDLTLNCDCVTGTLHREDETGKRLYANKKERETPMEKTMDKETIQTILDLINPLHGAIDQQTYDERYKQGFDAPRDAEYEVSVTAQQERDLTQAVLILESWLRDHPAPKRPPTSVEIAQRRASGLSLGKRPAHTNTSDAWRGEPKPR